MNPILFAINDYPIRTYLVVILAAILLAVLLIRYYEIPYLKARGSCPESIYRYNGESLLVALLFTVIGARLGFVITNWHLYVDDPLKILAIWRGGFAFHGAMAAVVLAVALHSYFRRIPLAKLLDLSIPYISLSYALGRVGCFLNGCCHGHLTDVPWGLVYPAIDVSTRHPTQLYSAAAALLTALALFYMHRKNHPDGTTFSWFLIFFGSYRLVVEFFRVGEVIISVLSLAQVISLAVITAGLVLLVILKRRRNGGAGYD